MSKIDIISGFLGAGKTTLIKKLIADADEFVQFTKILNKIVEVENT